MVDVSTKNSHLKKQLISGCRSRLGRRHWFQVHLASSFLWRIIVSSCRGSFECWWKIHLIPSMSFLRNRITASTSSTTTDHQAIWICGNRSTNWHIIATCALNLENKVSTISHDRSFTSSFCSFFNSLNIGLKHCPLPSCPSIRKDTQAVWWADSSLLYHLLRRQYWFQMSCRLSDMAHKSCYPFCSTLWLGKTCLCYCIQLWRMCLLCQHHVVSELLQLTLLQFHFFHVAWLTSSAPKPRILLNQGLVLLKPTSHPFGDTATCLPKRARETRATLPSLSSPDRTFPRNLSCLCEAPGVAVSSQSQNTCTPEQSLFTTMLSHLMSPCTYLFWCKCSSSVHLFKFSHAASFKALLYSLNRSEHLFVDQCGAVVSNEPSQVGMRRDHWVTRSRPFRIVSPPSAVLDARVSTPFSVFS